MRKAAPGKGAAVVDLYDWRTRQRLHTRRRSLNQLVEPLRRLKRLRQELNRWNAGGGARAMPQPWRYGLNLPDLKLPEIFWPPL